MYDKIESPLYNQLPGLFRKNKLFTDMAEVFDGLYKTLVEDPRIELQRIHIPYHPELDYPLLEKYYLIERARQMGFDFMSDVMDSEDYRHLVENLAEYYRTRSGTDFVRMIGFMRGLKFELVQLWCDSSSEDDFAVFYNSANGLKVIEGGTWYPTSHVELSYDADKFPVIYTEEINELFYIMAPINLVLKYITGYLNSENRTYHIPLVLNTQYQYAAFEVL